MDLLNLLGGFDIHSLLNKGLSEISKNLAAHTQTHEASEAIFEIRQNEAGEIFICTLVEISAEEERLEVSRDNLSQVSSFLEDYRIPAEILFGQKKAALLLEYVQNPKRMLALIAHKIKAIDVARAKLWVRSIFEEEEEYLLLQVVPENENPEDIQTFSLVEVIQDALEMFQTADLQKLQL